MRFWPRRYKVYVIYDTGRRVFVGSYRDPRLALIHAQAVDFSLTNELGETIKAAAIDPPLPGDVRP